MFLGEVGEEFTELESEDTDGSNVVFMGQVSEYEQPNLDDTPQTTPSGERVTTILVVHRGQVLPELRAHFCNDELQKGDRDIKIQLLLPNGTPEMGRDDGGVVRDCLSEFWTEFYEQYTM